MYQHDVSRIPSHASSNVKRFEHLWIFDPSVLFSYGKWKQFWPFCSSLSDSEVLNNASRLVLYASCITAVIQQDLTPLVIGPLVLLVALFVYISTRPYSCRKFSATTKAHQPGIFGIYSPNTPRI